MSKIDESKVVIVLDSDEEEEEIPTNSSNAQQHYNTILIDSDNEEEEKNQRLQAIIMNNVEKRPSSFPTNINKLFQKDTRLTNMKKTAKTRKGPQITQQQQSSTHSVPTTMSQLVEEHCDFDKHFRKLNSSSLDKELEEIISGDNDSPNVFAASPPRTNSIRDFESDPMSITDHSPLRSPARRNRQIDVTPTRPTTRKPIKREDSDEENSAEEDLEYYMAFLGQKRKLRTETNAIPNKTTKMQCPICYLLFPKSDLAEHAAECDGQETSNGIARKSISAAVLLEQKEREKKRKGVQDTGPTNYYLEGDILSTDGAGFNNEVTDGLNWESAGQTRFG